MKKVTQRLLHQTYSLVDIEFFTKLVFLFNVSSSRIKNLNSAFSGSNPNFVLLHLNMNLIASFLFVLNSFTLVLESRCAPITSLLQNNVAGPAVNFQTVSWPIDPDAGLRRRREYEAINGRFGNKAVERIGLGEDGRTEERRIQQRIRDERGALSYQPPLQ